MFKKTEIKHKIVTDPNFEKELADKIKVESRCELVKEKHRGIVSYVGKCPDLGDGYFVGI